MKVPTMVSDKLFRNAKLSNNLVEYEMCGCLTVVFNRGHSLSPFCEIIKNHHDVMMPPSQSWVAIHEVKTPFGEGTDGDNWM